MHLPTPDPDVIYRPVDGGGVLLSTKTEAYFGLNATGTYVWEHLYPVFRTLEELSTALHALYPEVPPETLREDARHLVADLVASGLVCPRADIDAGMGALPGVQETAQASAQRVG